MNNAKLYISANPMQTKDAELILNELKHTMTWSGDGEMILDVGSGPGDVTVNVLNNFIPNSSTIIGSDIATEMVYYANKQYKNNRIQFKTLDIQDNDIGREWVNASFDKIFSFYCLHWVQDQRQAAQNLYYLLKPGGEMLLIFLSDNPVYKLYESLGGMKQWNRYMKDAHRFISPYYNCENPAQQFQKLLKNANFSEVKVFNKESSFGFPSKDAVISSICAVNPFFERIPPELQNEYNNCVSRLIEELSLAELKENGQVEVKYSLIIARAKKM